MSFAKKYQSYLLVSFTCFFYYLVAYNLDRTNFIWVFSLYLSSFFLSFLLFKKEKENTSFLVSTSFFFRIIFLFSIPNLSQDFYRFIWDGRMIFEGLNPYITLPENFIKNRMFPVFQAQELYNGMGVLNGSHFTNYPPINQFNFLLASLFSNTSILGSVVVMRLQIIIADMGIFYFGKKILNHLKLPVSNIFLYLLNPLVIIELTGNLHFEAVMLFFIVWSLYLLFQKKWIYAAILLGISVSVKLIPILFLPLFYQFFQKENSLKNIIKFIFFGVIVVSINIILFLPFLSTELISSYSNSISLWFTEFEFNASFYYIAREIGYVFYGFNKISFLGKFFSVIIVIFIFLLSIFRDNTTPNKLISALLFALTFYYLASTTVHPWYLTTLVLLSVFTQYKFAFVWSLLVALSYHVYATLPWKESFWFIGIEYMIVLFVLIWETKCKTSKQLVQNYF